MVAPRSTILGRDTGWFHTEEAKYPGDSAPKTIKSQECPRVPRWGFRFVKMKMLLHHPEQQGEQDHELQDDYQGKVVKIGARIRIPLELPGDSQPALLLEKPPAA